MSWWRSGRVQQRSVSISDPALAALFNVGNPNYSGVPVGESTALGISAFFRAMSLISGSVAQLPMNTLRDVEGVLTRTSSVFDDPGGVVGMTPFEWKETVLLHQLLHGDAFLAHIFNGGGGLAGLVPIHPLAVTIDPPQRTEDIAESLIKTYSATLADGSRWTFTEGTDMTHCPAMSVDGRRGLSLISVARNSLGTAIAGDRAAAKMFSNGALISGLITPEEGETVDADDAKKIKEDLDARVTGWEHAGSLALVNRRLRFSPWTMSAEDAQFVQSRQFQIEEIARWTGVPPHLLMQTEKQTSWGTGVAEQNRGLSRFTLAPWVERLEQRLSKLLLTPRFVRFDFSEWDRPTPEQEIELLIKQVEAGLMTVNEARKIRGMDPIDGGDTLRGSVAAPASLNGELVPV